MDHISIAVHPFRRTRDKDVAEAVGARDRVRVQERRSRHPPVTATSIDSPVTPAKRPFTHQSRRQNIRLLAYQCQRDKDVAKAVGARDSVRIQERRSRHPPAERKKSVTPAERHAFEIC